MDLPSPPIKEEIADVLQPLAQEHIQERIVEQIRFPCAAEQGGKREGTSAFASRTHPRTSCGHHSQGGKRGGASAHATGANSRTRRGVPRGGEMAATSMEAAFAANTLMPSVSFVP